MERTAMLVLTRKVGERLRIGTDIVVTVLKVDRFGVQLGIEGPAHVQVRQASGAPAGSSLVPAGTSPVAKDGLPDIGIEEAAFGFSVNHPKRRSAR
jgi:carbon storage regulator